MHATEERSFLAAAFQRAAGGWAAWVWGVERTGGAADLSTLNKASHLDDPLIETSNGGGQFIETVVEAGDGREGYHFHLVLEACGALHKAGEDLHGVFPNDAAKTITHYP
eukprot:3885167-Pyramimonas_sp.AAC.1